MQALIDSLKQLPDGQLQKIVELAQQELEARYEACEEACDETWSDEIDEEEKPTLPDHIIEELKGLWAATDEAQEIKITHPVDYIIIITCTGYTGNAEEDIEIDWEYDNSLTTDKALAYTDVREAYNELHGKMKRFLARAKEVANQYGWDIGEIIDAVS